MPNPAALKAGIRKGMVRVGIMKSRGKAFLKARGVMKKMMMMLVVVLVVVSECQAFRIGGFEVSFQRGKPEWNADKTDTRCVGGGICTGKITFGIDIPSRISNGDEHFDPTSNMFSANLINYKNGLALEFSERYYNTYREDFSYGEFSINSEIVLTANVMRGLNYKGANKISKGVYQFVIDKETGAFLVLIK